MDFEKLKLLYLYARDYALLTGTLTKVCINFYYDGRIGLKLEISKDEKRHEFYAPIENIDSLIMLLKNKD